ncbi:MAG TPA: IS30 family transposase [Candidatus Paceibacterota bacterium]
MAKETKGRSPFTLRERSIIEVRWCRDNRSITQIAVELGRHKSSVSREIAGRPRKGPGRYDADRAQAQAMDRIEKRGNRAKTEKNDALRAYIEDKLINEKWSPEQVSIRLPIEFPDDPAMRIVTESVYQEVYRRVYRGGHGTVKPGMTDLRPHLARRHKVRAKQGFRKAQRVEREAAFPSIETRPAVVEARSRIGDWEDDTLVSRESVARLKNVTERRSGLTLFGKTRDGTAERCDAMLVEKLSGLPQEVRKTLTRDRGSENVRIAYVAEALGLDVYLAHAYASYERGTNENTNGLIRRFFPKGTDWATVSDEAIARAEYLINTRPRKRHGGLTPVEVFYEETGVAIYS